MILDKTWFATKLSKATIQCLSFVCYFLQEKHFFVNIKTMTKMRSEKSITHHLHHHLLRHLHLHLYSLFEPRFNRGSRFNRQTVWTDRSPIPLNRGSEPRSVDHGCCAPLLVALGSMVPSQTRSFLKTAWNGDPLPAKNPHGGERTKSSGLSNAVSKPVGPCRIHGSFTFLEKRGIIQKRKFSSTFALPWWGDIIPSIPEHAKTMI